MSKKDNENENEEDYVQTDTHLAIKFVNESANRIKWTLIVLTIASCLALACFWNSLQCSWKHQRVQKMKEYITYLDNTAKYEKEKSDINLQLINRSCYLNNSNDTAIGKQNHEDNKANDSCSYCLTDIKSLILAFERLKANEIPKPNFDVEFMTKYYGKDALGMDNLRLMYLACWLIEARDIRSFKMPFFDVSFDINDLGFIGGLGFSIILLIFYLSLIRGRENIKIAFKASELKFDENYKKRRQFYYLLSMNQLIIMPHIMNKKGKRYLKILPLTLLCFPFIFSFCVFINDIQTSKYGANFSVFMTDFEYFMSSFFLVVIIIFTVICIWELYLVDQLWKKEKIWLDKQEKLDTAKKDAENKNIKNENK